jgi:hypothetical protein
MTALPIYEFKGFEAYDPRERRVPMFFVGYGFLLREAETYVLRRETFLLHHQNSHFDVQQQSHC